MSCLQLPTPQPLGSREPLFCPISLSLPRLESPPTPVLVGELLLQLEINSPASSHLVAFIYSTKASRKGSFRNTCGPQGT